MLHTILTLLIVFLSVGYYSPRQVEAVACPGITSSLSPSGYEQITVSTTAVGLTLPSNKVRMAVAVVEDQAIRYRDDGTDPTATVGTLLKADNSVAICGSALGHFKVIRDGASDAKLSVNYYQ